MAKLKALCVTGLGTGYLPIAPGTWGSAAVAALYLLVGWAAGGSAWATDAAMLATVAVSCVLCVALGSFAERHFGKKDPGQVTIDEWAGQALAFVALPVGGAGGRLAVAATAFAAFRLFDILKPPPARSLEKLPRGWGVLLDDLAAGVYANIAAQLLLRFVLA